MIKDNKMANVIAQQRDKSTLTLSFITHGTKIKLTHNLQSHSWDFYRPFHFDEQATFLSQALVNCEISLAHEKPLILATNTRTRTHARAMPCLLEPSVASMDCKSFSCVDIHNGKCHHDNEIDDVYQCSCMTSKNVCTKKSQQQSHTSSSNC